ncbi:methyltransferase family protein [Actinopolymorpha pittospori]
MEWLALGIYLTGAITALGVRSWQQYRATGDSGHRHGQVPTGSAAWWARVLFAGALLLFTAALTLTATGALPMIATLEGPASWTVGLLVTLVGFAVVLTAQQTMGASWRIGVDETERTDLVVRGMFTLVRNPIFTGMITATAGLTLMAPSWLQLGALACLVTGIELQVRVVEEPYLARTHGAAYSAYTSRVGRFLPRVGRGHLDHAPSGD